MEPHPLHRASDMDPTKMALLGINLRSSVTMYALGTERKGCSTLIELDRLTSARVGGRGTEPSADIGQV